MKVVSNLLNCRAFPVRARWPAGAALLEMLRKQIEEMDDITAVIDEVRGIAERNSPQLMPKPPPRAG
jgi:hypothetical protein